MQIVLGLDFDTGAYPDTLTLSGASCGEVLLGPLGLLEVLETQLGLSRSVVHQAVRIAQYLKLLREMDNGKRFYSESFNADAWSTAKEILSWRDELALAGWKSEHLNAPTPRLEVLTDLERLGRDLITPSTGNRLWLVIKELRTHKNIDIRSIHLVESREVWPFGFCRAFDLLENLSVQIQEVERAIRVDESDLGTLKQALLRGDRAARGISGDGSLMIVRSDTEHEAAEVVASWLSSSAQNNGVVIIKGTGSQILDERLQRFGLARLGSSSTSRWRSALQILPLLLTNLWKPFNPYRLLELLKLPKSPIPRNVATLFEAALPEHPGVNGPLWAQAWEHACSDFMELLKGQDQKETEANSELEEFKAGLRFWLGENQYGSGEYVPAAEIEEVCRKTSQWAAKQAGGDGDELLFAVASMGRETAQAIQATGLSSISKPQIDRIVDSVVGEGLKNQNDHPEAAPWSQVAKPGQIWGPVEHLVWWNCVTPDNGSLHCTWTNSEKLALEASGATIESPSVRRLREAKSWYNPIFSTEKHLILVIPRSMDGEGVSHHPIWDEIKYRLKLEESLGSAGKVTFDARKLYEDRKSDLCGRTMIRDSAPFDPPPPPKKNWHIPEKVFAGRNLESYTSISSIIQCPLSWFLNYVLRLRPGALMSLPDGSELIGTLAHLVVEMLFAETTFWDPPSAEARARELYDQLVPQVAAPLLQPGRELERQQYRETLGHAVGNLVSLIHSSRFRVIGFEKDFQKPFPVSPGTLFQGTIDLLLESPNGQKVIWDLKWSKSSKYKREELTAGKALQLAAYAWLVADDKTVFPSAGYFMLGQGELLSVSCEGLPEQCEFHGLDLRETWEKAVHTYRERVAELDRGVVQAAGISGEEEVGGNPEKLLEIEAHCDWCDFASFCGWRAK